MNNMFKADNSAEILSKLVDIESKLDALLEKGSSVESEPQEEAKVDPAEWMSIAQKFIGIDEDEDENQVILFSKIAETPIESSETPWCAIFVNAVLAEAGFQTTGTMRARDFETYGEPCEEKYGAIVVYKSHVGFVPEKGEVLGGNQSDGVNVGQQSWYGKPISYRWPAVDPKKRSIS